MKIADNFSLLSYNTFGLPVFCRRFYEYETEDELRELIKSGVLNSSPWLHIGGGSNLLFLHDFDGIVLHSQIKGIEIVKETAKECIVRVGAGEVWDDFVAWSVDHQLGGAENLSLIPGEVGASPVQNIGAYGVEAQDIIQQVETISVEDSSCCIFQKEECGFSYRNSIFKKNEKHIVTHVVFCLHKPPFYTYNLEYGKLRETLSVCSEITLLQIRNAVIAIRNEKLPDPKEIGNAGSFFKNPVIAKEKFEQLQKTFSSMPHYAVGESEEKIPAGWLIEQCGWKGKVYKHAGVYEKQALVLVNNGGASGCEIRELAQQIQDSVNEKFGINIEPEVRMIGNEE